MENTKTSTKVKSLIASNGIHAYCIQCGNDLGVYIPPCQSHRFICTKCKAELEVNAAINEAGFGSINCNILSTKETRTIRA